MRRMEFNEFNTRTRAVAKARRIFIGSGITKNITHAFELYQGVLAEEERLIHVQPIPDKFREKCPSCNDPMKIGPINNTPGNQIGGDWKSQWYCGKCDESVFDLRTVNQITESAREPWPS